MEWRAVALFLIGTAIATLVPLALASHKLCARLRDQHVSTWRELGEPTLSSPFREPSTWQERNRLLRAFLKSGRISQLGDPELARVASALRWLNRGVSILFWATVASVVLAALESAA